MGRRVVYHPISTLDGASGDSLGMFRVTESGTVTRLIPGSAIHLSCVAAGGVVIAEIQDSAGYRMMARCTDGSVVAVPVPVPADVKRTFSPSLPPRVALSANAHYAAYLGLDHPTTPSRDGSQSRLTLVRVSCSTRAAETFDVHDSVRARMASLGVAAARPAGNQVLVNEDGSRIWFVVTGVRFPADVEELAAWQIWEWNNGTLHPVTAPDARAYALRGFDNTTGTLLYEHGDTLFAASGSSRKVLTLPAASLVWAQQLAVSASRMVVFGTGGIELRSPVTGALISTPVLFTHPTLTGCDAQAAGRALAIAPDGGAIVFMLARSDGSGRRSVFMASTDGSRITMLLPAVACGMPVISDPL